MASQIDGFVKTAVHEQLEAAIDILHSEDGEAAQKAYGAAMDAILALMDGNLIIPVESAGDDGEYNQRMLQMNSGENIFVAFTDTDKAQAGPETLLAVQNTEEFFSAAMINEIVSGVMFNPWGNTFFLDKGDIKRLFAAMIPEERKNLIGFLDTQPDEYELYEKLPQMKASEIDNGDILWNELERIRANDCHLLAIPTLIADMDSSDDVVTIFLHTLSDWLNINAGYSMAVCFIGDTQTADKYREIWDENSEAWNQREIIRENNGKLEAAIAYAMECHKGASAKGTNLPYILHPIETVQILTRMNADTNLLCAGILHDTLEDTDATLLEIYRRFGADVAALVNVHTEDKRRSWYYRKLHTLTKLPEENIRVKMCAMADKVSNLRRLWSDYKKIGDELWERFNAPKEMQAWYYSGLVDAFYEMQNYPETEELYWEMNNLYKDLFVSFYIDEENGLLYQADAGGELHILKKGKPEWKTQTAPVPKKAQPIHRKYAERVEDNWNDPFWEAHHYDMMDGQYTLYQADGREIVLSISKSTLVLTDNDKALALDEANTNRFLVQLRLKYSTRNKLQTMLEKEFGGADAIEKFKAFCEAVQVEIHCSEDA